MVMITVGMVLSMMAALDANAPKRASAQNVAAAIVSVVDLERPIFGSGLMDAGVLVEMGYRESRWMPALTGDHHRSLCEYQLQNAPIRVMWDINLCTKIAYERLRASARDCTDAPLAIYAGGSCRNRTARRISDARMAEAARIEVAAAETNEDEDADIVGEVGR